MIARHLREVASAQEIGAAIAYVGHRELVVAEERGGQRGAAALECRIFSARVASVLLALCTAT